MNHCYFLSQIHQFALNSFTAFSPCPQFLPLPLCLARQSQHQRLAPLSFHSSLPHLPSALSIINLSSLIPFNSHGYFKCDRARSCAIIFIFFLHISCQAKQMRLLCSRNTTLRKKLLSELNRSLGTQSIKTALCSIIIIVINVINGVAPKSSTEFSLYMQPRSHLCII